MTSTLTAFADLNPVPRVEVVVDPADLLAGTDTVTLRRTADDRQMDVRGGIERGALTTLVVFDYEAPFGIVSSYEAVCYDAGVYIGVVQLGTVTLTYSGTVIQQPLDPRLCATVTVLDGSGSSIPYASRGELVYTEDDELAAYVGAGPLAGIAGVTLRLAVDSVAMGNRLLRTRGWYGSPQLPVWVIRSSTEPRLPAVLFCHVPTVAEVEFDLHLPGGGETIIYETTVSEMLPPAPGLSPAVLRYSDVEAVYADYSDIEAVYTLYSDIQRDQALIGAAG